jgi:hypothetical protein
MAGNFLTHRITGNTSGATASMTGGSIVLAGGNNITLSQQSNTVTIIGGAGGPGGGIALAAGTQTATSGTVLFSNEATRVITFGMSNSSVITASVPGLSTLYGAGIVTVTVNGGSITISATAGGGAAPERRYIELMQGERITSIRAMTETAGTNRPIFIPFWIDGTGIQPQSIRLFFSGSSSSNRTLQCTLRAGLYSLANSTQLSLFGSASAGVAISSASGSWYHGFRWWDITGITGTMSNEGRWVLAVHVSNAANNISNNPLTWWGAENMPVISGGFMGGVTQATSTNGSNNILPFWGVYSTTTNAFPATVAHTQVYGGNSASLYDLYGIIKEQ